jgi:hypothetical protein
VVAVGLQNSVECDIHPGLAANGQHLKQNQEGADSKNFAHMITLRDAEHRHADFITTGPVRVQLHDDRHVAKKARSIVAPVRSIASRRQSPSPAFTAASTLAVAMDAAALGAKRLFRLEFRLARQPAVERDAGLGRGDGP